MTTPAKILDNAAGNLTAEFGRFEFDNTVDDKTALEAVDAEYIGAWLTVNGGIRTPHQMCVDVMQHTVQSLTDAEALALLQTLPGFRAYVAADLKFDAQRIIDEEPSDEQLESQAYSSAVSYARDVADPVRLARLRGLGWVGSWP